MKDKIKIILGLIFFCGILSWGFGVSADTIFTDDFNDYNFGYLNGQGGWLATPNYMVSDVPVKEGAKAVFGFSFAVPVQAIKSGALLNDGKITVYVRRFDANQQGVFSFILREGTDAKIEVRGNVAYAARFQYIDGLAGSYVNFGPFFNVEQWYAVQIEWRSSDHSARYNIDGGTWTDWFPSIAPWVAGLDTVELETTNAMAWDAIQEAPIDSSKTPVLIVPGLIGTDLKDGDNVLWMDPQRLLSSISDNFIDPLQFKVDLTPLNSGLTVGEVISSKTFDIGFGEVVVLNYMASLVDELKSQGYIENETLFTFPYDWRYGVTGEYADGKTNTDLLEEKIAAILQQTGASKVDIIAHSMGGLITKKYVVDNLASHNIGKAVFVGVPNTGAPKSVKTLLEGDNLGSLFVSQGEIKKISQNMPAIYDLLPSQQYYNTKGSYVRVIDQGFINATVKDLTYSETKTFLTDDNNLNTTAVTNADNLHTTTFDNFDMRTAGIDLYAIDGCKAGTLGKITQVRSKSILGQLQITYQKPKMVPGDGTVPLESATNLPIDQNKKYYALTNKNSLITGEDKIGVHGHLLSNDGTRQQIVNLIAGSNLAINDKIITQDITECKLNGKAISVFSPVDIYVTDQDGNDMGLASDGSIFNEIPNADFQMWGEPFDSAQGKHKFLYLPTDSGQTYNILLDGTGEGTYTIKNEDIENNEVVKTQVFSNLPVTEALTGTINFGTNGAKDFLIIKQNANSPPETILPSPPEIVIQFDPVAKDLKFLSSEPTVTVVDQDDIVTLTDQVGNVTELKLKSKNRKKSMRAEIKSLTYNGVLADITKNTMAYTWNYDKQGNLKKLTQHIKSKKEYNISAEFDAKTNTTNITGKDATGKIKKTVNGLQIISVLTNQGDFSWGY